MKFICTSMLYDFSPSGGSRKRKFCLSGFLQLDLHQKINDENIFSGCMHTVHAREGRQGVGLWETVHPVVC